MERILLGDLHDHIDKEVTINGWVDVRRDHGKLVFIDLRDRSGTVQMVVKPDHADAHETACKTRAEWTLEVHGKVQKRDEKMTNKDQPNGDLEIVVTGIAVLNEAQEMPFDYRDDVNLDTYLDHLPFTLKNERSQNIFKVQATIIRAFKESMRNQDFLDYSNPVLVGGDGEGGASAFKVEYFKDKTALLATSPQLYKQMLVGVFERVSTVTKAFRAEKHATTRHLSEAVQMDFEMGFVNDDNDVMDVLETTMRDVVTAVTEKHGDILEKFETDAPKIPEGNVPRLALEQIQEILEKEFDIKCKGELDLEPEHERKICEWALKEHGSDFVFVTNFPSSKRPFYTHGEPDKPGISRGFDLLFRGLEINSGAQRIHDYDTLVEKIKENGLDPEVFSFYLQAFKYGMPPHGGCSTGLERLTARMLELSNVKEATLFPRDINRIDTRLSD